MRKTESGPRERSFSKNEVSRPVLSALIFTLYWTLPLPLLGVVVFLVIPQVQEYRAENDRTEAARASKRERIIEAIYDYHQRHGHYPDDIGNLGVDLDHRLMGTVYYHSSERFWRGANPPVNQPPKFEIGFTRYCGDSHYLPWHIRWEYSSDTGTWIYSEIFVFDIED